PRCDRRGSASSSPIPTCLAALSVARSTSTSSADNKRPPAIAPSRCFACAGPSAPCNGPMCKSCSASKPRWFRTATPAPWQASAPRDPREDRIGGHMGGLRGLASLTGDSLLQSRAVTFDTRLRFGPAEILGEAFVGQAIAGLGGGAIGQNAGVGGAPVRTHGG